MPSRTIVTEAPVSLKIHSINHSSSSDEKNVTRICNEFTLGLLEVIMSMLFCISHTCTSVLIKSIC